MNSTKVTKPVSLLEKQWRSELGYWIFLMIISFPTVCLFVIVILMYQRKRREFLGVKGLRDNGKIDALNVLL